MKKTLTRKLIIFNLLCSSAIYGQTSVHLLEPSRDGKKEQLLQIGKNDGTKILTMSSCTKCMPATYVYNEKASKAMGKAVFGKSGIYILPYDANSYVSVAPKSPPVALGEGIWDTFLYSNFFSTDKNKVSAMTKAKVEKWAITLSKKIMNGNMSTSFFDASENTYYSALKPSKSLPITITAKTIKIDSDVFYLNTQFSKELGVKVYSEDANKGEHIFIESSVSLIWAKYHHGRDLGKSEWGEYEKFNYYHKNQQEIRSLLISKEKQNNIDVKLASWSLQAKQYATAEYARKEAAEIKNRKLPQKGLKNTSLESQALTAAKNWAVRYSWEETITKVYFTGNDWSVYRNSLTGLQLGRRISGVIVLKRKDGKCSFHYASFAQDYDGNGYQRVFTEGITPGQNILECKNVN